MLPRVILHAGMSLDGREDWSRLQGSPYYDLALVLQADADLSGSNTMLAAYLPEDPRSAFPGVFEKWIRLTERPMLAVVDSRGRVRNWDLIKKQPWWGSFMALCSRSTPQSYLEYLQAQGIDTIVVGDRHVDLHLALEELRFSYKIKTLRVDSGGILNGELLRGGLVDEVSLVINPELVGGTTPRSMFVSPDLTSPDGVIPLRLIHVEKLKGDFLWVRYEVIK